MCQLGATMQCHPSHPSPAFSCTCRVAGAALIPTPAAEPCKLAATMYPCSCCPPLMLCLQIGSTALNHAPGPCHLDAIMQGQLTTLSLWHLQGGKSSAGIWTSVAEHPTSFAVTDLDGSEDGDEVAVSVAAELLPQAVSDSLSSEVDCTAWLDTERWVQHDWRAGFVGCKSRGGAHHCMRPPSWAAHASQGWETLQQLRVCPAR